MRGGAQKRMCRVGGVRARVTAGCRTVALGSLLPLLLSAAPPGFTVRYEIIDLGTLGGSSSVALGINNKGQVVGGADATDGLRRAYLWENGKLTDLGDIGRTAHYGAWDINENTQIVGNVTSNGNIQDAFIWEDGKMTELGDPAQAKSAFAINDAGQVVGAAIFPPPGGGQRAFLLANGLLTDLQSAAGVEWTLAWDINNVGEVVGGPYIWEPDSLTVLPTLGGDLTGIQGINDSGDAAGWSERVSGERIFHAFLWENGEMTDLGLLLDPLGAIFGSRAEAINNRGQVVGTGTVQVGVAGTITLGFLFDPIEGMVLLKDTLPEGHGWSDLSPRDINDNGQIAGWGVNPEGFPIAFLMNPLPSIPAISPELLALLATALLITAYVVLGRRLRLAHE